MKKSTLLKMSHISKSYPGVKAVNDVSIDLYAGEVLGLMGENGAGKSTLIKLLAGAEMMDSGEIFIEDKSININSPKESQENGVSVIYQELITMDTLSVAENIFVGQLPRKNNTKLIDWKTAQKKSSEVLAMLNSDIDPKTIVSSLSTIFIILSSFHTFSRIFSGFFQFSEKGLIGTSAIIIHLLSKVFSPYNDTLLALLIKNLRSFPCTY